MQIQIRLPNGGAKEGVRGVTTPQDILQQLPRSVAKKAVVAKVNGQVWDMFVPLEGECDLQILTFEDPEGKEVMILCRPAPQPASRLHHAQTAPVA